MDAHTADYLLLGVIRVSTLAADGERRDGSGARTLHPKNKETMIL